MAKDGTNCNQGRRAGGDCMVIPYEWPNPELKAFVDKYEAELSTEHRETMKSLLLDPDLGKIFKDKILEFEEAINESKKAQWDIYERVCKELDADKKEWLIWLLDNEKTREKEARGGKKKFEFFKRKNDGKEMKELDITGAKSYPIIAILEEYGCKGESAGSGRAKYKCPLHNEDTPSFTVFKKDNHWRCFGCGEGGDPIDLVMKLYNLPFVEAVKKLL